MSHDPTNYEQPAPAEAERAPRAAPGHVSAVDGVALPCFDGLRATALILVYGYHSVALFRGSTLSPTVKDWILHSGTTALTMFFVISGCLLYRPFVLAHFEARNPPRGAQFLKRRCARIFPAYWFALTLAIYVMGLIPRPDLDDFATLYGLVQNYRVGYLKAGLNVSWTLVIEVVYYLSLPLLAALIRWAAPREATLRTRLAIQLASLIGLYLAAHAARAWLLWSVAPASSPPGSWFGWRRVVEYPFTYYDWLSLGMILAVASAWLSVGGGLPRIVAALGRRPLYCWILACLFYAAIGSLGIRYGAEQTPAQEMGLKCLQGFAALCMVLPGVAGPQKEGSIRRLLRSRSMVFLGTISYGVYLWHLTMIKLTSDWVAAGRLPNVFLVEIGVA